MKARHYVARYLLKRKSKDDPWPQVNPIGYCYVTTVSGDEPDEAELRRKFDKSAEEQKGIYELQFLYAGQINPRASNMPDQFTMFRIDCTTPYTLDDIERDIKRNQPKDTLRAVWGTVGGTRIRRSPSVLPERTVAFAPYSRGEGDHRGIVPA